MNQENPMYFYNEITIRHYEDYSSSKEDRGVCCV